MPADAILTSVLDRSGYLAELHGSTDPQDETRLENLKELITVAREFVTGVATLTVPEEELDELGLPGDSDAPPEGIWPLRSTQRPTWRRGRQNRMRRWARSWSESHSSRTPTRYRTLRTRQIPVSSP